MGNFDQNVRRLAQSEDYLPDRETKKKCSYSQHDGPRKAVLFVEVPIEECCNDEANRMVPICWRDAINILTREEFYCACGQDGSKHKSADLTYKGDIQPVTV